MWPPMHCPGQVAQQGPIVSLDDSDSQTAQKGSSPADGGALTKRKCHKEEITMDFLERNGFFDKTIQVSGR